MTGIFRPACPRTYPRARRLPRTTEGRERTGPRVLSAGAGAEGTAVGLLEIRSGGSLGCRRAAGAEADARRVHGEIQTFMIGLAPADDEEKEITGDTDGRGFPPPVVIWGVYERLPMPESTCVSAGRPCNDRSETVAGSASCAFFSFPFPGKSAVSLDVAGRRSVGGYARSFRSDASLGRR